MRRLYLPIKDYPFYNSLVDSLMTSSEILNGGSSGFSLHKTLWTTEAVKAKLLELNGDENGLYMYDGELLQAVKPTLLKRIQEVEEQFEDYKQLRKNQGYEQPAEMPEKMLREYYKTKAALTVIEAEAEVLSKRLKQDEDKTVAKNDAKILEYGLLGFGKLRDNYLVEIDFQEVGQSAEGHLIICDKRSKYLGMLVTDYKKLCIEWQEARRLKELEAFKLLQESYREQGLRVPQEPPVTGCRPVNKSELPEFPTWAKKYEI